MAFFTGPRFTFTTRITDAEVNLFHTVASDISEVNLYYTVSSDVGEVNLF